MKQKKPSSNDLRSKAEEALNSVEDSSIEFCGEDMSKLIHELRVHQIELEMQNEEMRSAQAELEESRTRYADVYDFAPVGYLTFDQQGLIVEVNLTAANQLGTRRAALLKKPFFLYLLQDDRDLFRLHLAEVFKTSEKQTCEVRLNPRNSEEFFARLDSIFIEDTSGKGLVRTSMSDITSLKRAEEVLTRSHRELKDLVAERTTELSAANEQLRREVDSRVESLRFERLISDLSARFVNIALDQVDEAIESGLKQILDFFQVDRCGLLGFAPDRKRVHVTHAAYAEGIEQVEVDIDLVELFPWCYEKLVMQGQPVCLASIEELPVEALQDRATHTAMGVRSVLDIPLFFKGSVSSIIVINTLLRNRSWPEEYIPRLRLLGEIFINALEHRNAYGALRESETRLSLAADASGAMLWNLDVGSGHIWITEKAKEFFGFAPGSDMSLESFLSIVHPEDRDNLRRAVEVTIQSGSDNSAEYRIVRPDGSISWVYARGRRYGAKPGSDARLMGVALDITKRKQDEEEIRKSYCEIIRLKERLEAENIYLQEEVKLLVEHKEIVAQSLAMKKVLAQVEQVARTDSTVLIQGETGTGKELVARELHRLSSRKERPLITVNCASLPPTLIESELFGRERGAYTGALTKMIGRFEIADGSTLFLDEISEIPVELQSKLLRVVEEGSFERLGSTKPLHVDVRIIAATNRDLESEVKGGRFRKDLFYRLNVFPIVIPPLRERPEDIPPMVWAFVNEFQQKMGKEIENISQRTMEALQVYSWPGNVRELRNVVERAMIVSKGKSLFFELPAFGMSETDAAHSLENIERKHIAGVLEKTGWRIGGKGGAAEALALKRSTLYSKMRKLGITRPGL
ncbi:MAG: sigma 54-interacting transcriptional regulator [Syntrophobacteraceae bacterium]